MNARPDRQPTAAAASRGALHTILHVTTAQWAAAMRAEGAFDRARSIETPTPRATGRRVPQSAARSARFGGRVAEPSP